GRVGAPEPAPQANFTKATELFHEVAYNLASFAMPAPYPFYRADRYYNLVLDYLSGIPGLVMAGARQARARAVVDRLAGQRYFLLPLQLQSDYQLRANAPFAHQRDALDLVLRSFA